MDKFFELIKTLPPVVAAVSWDVFNGRITETTVKLAQRATPEEYQKYDLIRCLVVASVKYPPLQEAEWLLKEMVEEMPEGITR